MIQRQLMLLRRELWEHRVLYLAPMIVAGVMVFGFVLAFVTALFQGVPFDVGVATMEIGGAPATLTGGAAIFGVSIGSLNLVLGAVIFIYCLNALSTERKDKSILFWRSLPVTDTETVISKLLTAVVVAPVLCGLTIIATQFVLLVLASLSLLIGGGNPIELIWKPLPFMQVWLLVIYALVTSLLWMAPVIAWILLASSFARRSVLLWVSVPVILLVMLEGIVLHGGYIAKIIGERIGLSAIIGFDVDSNIDPDDIIEKMITSGDVNILEFAAPMKFLMMPGLWGGLVVAAIFIVGAIYCRRFRS